MTWRLPIGFLIAPIVPALAVAVLMESFQAATSESPLNWSGVPGVFLMILMVAELVTIVVAVPLFFVIRRFRKIGLLECVAGGAVIGILAGPVGVVTGTLSALVFWLVAARSLRPLDV